MERVRLTKAEKQVLRMISKGIHLCPSEYPLHTFNTSVRTLFNKGFIQAMFQEGGGVIDTKMTDYGVQYMAQYPLLHNPVNWSLVVASISAIGTILALFIACTH